MQPPSTQAPFDVIAVLGARLEPDGRPSPRLARRVERGIALLRAGRAPRLLLSGGSPGGGPNSEAEAMARQALAAGLPHDDLILEDRSRTTWENALFSARLLRAEGLSRVLLVSDRLHLPRALLCFRSQGLETRAAAAENGWLEQGALGSLWQAGYEGLAILGYLPRLLRSRQPG